MKTTKVMNVHTGKMENCTVGAGCQRHAHTLKDHIALADSILDRKWFVFDQNNSGGVFADPAQYLIIEAKNFKEANELAEQAGAYFDSEYEKDCSCCGQRWYPQSSNEINEYTVFESEKDAVAFVKKSEPFDKEVPFYMLVN
jgi:hypothetical protein